MQFVSTSTYYSVYTFVSVSFKAVKYVSCSINISKFINFQIYELCNILYST